jgi:hypothetical protein
VKNIIFEERSAECLLFCLRPHNEQWYYVPI